MNAPAKIQAPTLEKLREPFPANQISKLPKPTKAQTDAVKADFRKGVRCNLCSAWHHPDVVHLDYVGHAALTDRLLDTDPEWSWEPVAFSPEGLPAFDKTGGLWIKLTVLGVTRYGYGHAAAKQNQDPGAREKEVIGDALRNAAMRFGAALDLWHKGDLHAIDGDDSRAEETPLEQPERISKVQWARIVALLKSTSSNSAAILKHFEVDDLKKLTAMQAIKTINQLEDRLAEMAKGETDKAASGFGEIADDEIPY